MVLVPNRTPATAIASSAIRDRPTKGRTVGVPWVIGILVLALHRPGCRHRTQIRLALAPEPAGASLGRGRYRTSSGRLCARRGAQPPPQRSRLRLAGLADDDGPDCPAVADGFVLRLGELAVAVASTDCIGAATKLWWAFTPSPSLPGGTGPEARIRAEASPQRRGFAGPARLRLAAMELGLLDLAQPLASAARLAPLVP